MTATLPLLRPFLLLLLTLLAQTGQAQSGKSFFKEGEEHRKQQQLDKALERYGLAIQVDPRMVKAYQARADVLQLLGRPAEELADRRKAAELEPADPLLAAAAAQTALTMGEAAEARTWSERALNVDGKCMPALQTLVRACLALNELDCATSASNTALDQKATTDTYFLHGLARKAVRDYKAAESDFERVIEWNHLYEDAYVELAEVQLLLYAQYSGPTMQMRTLDKAVEKTSTALELNPQSTGALFTRSKAYALQKEYAKAIDDISRVVALGRTDGDVYMQRASYYQGYGQFQNAINDLNRVLQARPDNVDALVARSACKEANVDLEGAEKDLTTALKVIDKDPGHDAADRAEIEASRQRIAQLVFEMNRESDPPLITVLEPFRKEGDLVQVSSALNYVKVSGHVRDKSKLKQITVNGLEAGYSKDDKDPEFVVSIPFEREEKEIVVQAVDVYDNVSSEVLRVERTEGIAPSIALTTPKPTGEREITIPSGKDDVFVEGLVSDGSLIRMISVDGINASYAPDMLNPDFSIKVAVKDKDRFVVRAEDQYGNAAEVAYAIVRKAPEPVVAQHEPKGNGQVVTSPTPSSSTGITWLVQIDNSNYRNFPAVGGTDASKMQKAFSNYSIQRTLTKKNLTKEQMERFFNIELRDLVRSNKVGTVLIWYNGHGRSVGGKAYWVPVDARKDDIYSYFNYGSLKAQVQNYSESVSNTVVVSDAAGSDASFYELTR